MGRVAKLRRRIVVLGVVPPAVLALAITSLLVIEGWRLTDLVAAQTEATAHEQLARTARDVELLCEASHGEIQRQVNDNMRVARDVLSRAGAVTLGREKVSWRAVSQDDGTELRVELPKLLVGGKWLGHNADLARPTPLVDDVQRLVGGAATVFQRINERGDMIRVATNVITRERTRAVGTYLPAVGEDGTPNPVIAHVLRGEPFRGRAFVVDAWYLTVYEPLRDATGALVGMLFVGVRQDSLENIRSAIRSVRFGASGDVVVLGGTGGERGVYTIAADSRHDGANVWDARDASGTAYIQDLVTRAMALAPRSTAAAEYTIERPGSSERHARVAAVAYFAPWDWVIVASMRRDEATEAGRRVIGSMSVAVCAVLAVAAALLAAAAWAAHKAVARIAEPVEALEQVLDNVGQGFLAIDAEGAISRDRSAIVDRWFGELRSPEPIWRYLGREDAEFAAELERRWPALFDSARSREASVARMPRRVHRSGRTFDVEYRVVKASGGTQRVILVVSDVTTALAKERRERQMQAELQQAQKMEAVGRLASGIAHDFNNLLVVINTCSEFLLEALPDGDPRRADAEDIRHAGQRAARLVAQLLAFGRRSQGHAVTTDLNAVVSGLEKLIRRSLGETIDVSFALAPEPWSLCIDPAQLEQVVLNLVLNARDAMPRGGTLRIETLNEPGLRAHESGGEAQRTVALRVSDDGTGMTPEVTSRIFEPFFTTKDPGKGTGLGLATVFGIVRQAGGTIDVASEPGRGSSFTIALPAVEAVVGDPAPAAPLHAVDGDGRPILLVEDEDAVRRVAQRILARRGFRVVEARNGDEALLRLRDTRVELVVTDVVMPGMSGPELAARLRESQPSLPIVFMSGYTNRQDLWDGGTLMLSKPFTEDALLGKVDEALSRRERVA